MMLIFKAVNFVEFFDGYCFYKLGKVGGCDIRLYKKKGSGSVSGGNLALKSCMLLGAFLTYMSKALF